MTTVVYTDGACRGNPGPGGWAWVVPDGPFGAGPASDTTNQRMELQAALEAVRAIEGPIEIVSDSTYVVKCFQDKWYEGWLRRGWVNSAKKPVANRDLWEPLVELVLERGDVTFRWVKGHAGNKWNDMADALAVEASHTQQDRTGDRTPAAGEVADQRDLKAATKEKEALDARPSGHLLLVAGHQPPELGGYEPNPISDGVRHKLEEIIAAKTAMYEDLVVVSGLRLGAETLGAEAALAVGASLHVVLPYPDPETKWPPDRQRHFRSLVDQAAGVQTLQRVAPLTKERAGAAMARRDGWLANNVDEAVLVWDGEDARLKGFAAKLESSIPDEVWYLAP